MQQNFTQADPRKSSVSALLHNVPVLTYIEPPREILKGPHRPNCLFTKQLNPLPFVMKCCDELYELGFNNQDVPTVINPENARVVYKRQVDLLLNPFEPKIFFRSLNVEAKVTSSKSAPTCKEGQLVFDSNFQSGNLLQARKDCLSHKYHLLMQNDVNTYGCTQWFFFRALNREKLKATFCINNFYKPQSLYRFGMKVLVFSKKKFIEEGSGWVRGTENISYFQNKGVEKRQGGAIIKKFYTLKFDFKFEDEDDEVYFAYNYPYTYSKLNSYLTEKAREKHPFYSCRTLCRTIAENRVSLVTITDNDVPKEKKNTIFVTSRVHPGETVSSLVMEGVIDFLTGNSPMAARLRQKFIFRLIPMLNPDGVIHGNYRTNLAGIDLNRIWHQTDKDLSPEIYQLKKFIFECHKQCPILMFCDFHGHSTRKSAFIYGCDPLPKGKNKKKLNQSRLFPFMLSSENQDFRFGSCNFKVQKEKEGTARIQLWRQLKISNVYTLQASFCSSEDSQYHFRPSDYRQIGVSFCKTINEFFLNEEKKTEFAQQLKSLGELPQMEVEMSDSESDTDLFNQKILRKLKNGNKQPIEKPKVEFESEQSAQKKNSLPQSSIRRPYHENTRRALKTEGSREFRTLTTSISPSRKMIQVSIPTKRIVFQTEVMKPMVRKNNMLRQSVVQRIEHGYRGKSSFYRIKKKFGCGDSQIVLAMDSSLDH